MSNNIIYSIFSSNIEDVTVDVTPEKEIVFHISDRFVLLGIHLCKHNAGTVSSYPYRLVPNPATSDRYRYFEDHHLLRSPLVSGYDYSSYSLAPGSYRLYTYGVEDIDKIILTVLKLD